MMDPHDALEMIRDTWMAWANDEIGELEAMSQIAEALEASGQMMIDRPANDA